MKLWFKRMLIILCFRRSIRIPSWFWTQCFTNVICYNLELDLTSVYTCICVIYDSPTLNRSRSFYKQIVYKVKYPWKYGLIWNVQRKADSHKEAFSSPRVSFEIAIETTQDRSKAALPESKKSRDFTDVLNIEFLKSYAERQILYCGRKRETFSVTNNLDSFN